jgi:hypothetical protein
MPTEFQWELSKPLDAQWNECDPFENGVKLEIEHIFK